MCEHREAPPVKDIIIICMESYLMSFYPHHSLMMHRGLSFVFSILCLNLIAHILWHMESSLASIHHQPLSIYRNSISVRPARAPCVLFVFCLWTYVASISYQCCFFQTDFLGLVKEETNTYSLPLSYLLAACLLLHTRYIQLNLSCNSRLPFRSALSMLKFLTSLCKAVRQKCLLWNMLGVCLCNTSCVLWEQRRDY